jgi:hypothetical protein
MASITTCGLQADTWEPSGAVGFRVEVGEVPANDLFGGITFDVLRAGVPARHVAVDIQHIDGIVGDTLNEQSELFFAFAKFSLGGSSFGQVAGDFGEADKLPPRRADRVDDHMGPELGAVLAYAPALALEAAGAFGLRQRESRDVLRPLSVGVKR